ncbi:MAG TPA: FG-GAP-like repeat-containing protein [Pirellulales bacterium]|nr:FG-GAP-like repeat-containing protein [Pirellulales bacterium]
MSQAADVPPPRAHHGRWIVGAAVAGACAVIVVVACFTFRNDLSPQECELLEAKKNIAVGYLENGPLAGKRPNKLSEADSLFEEIRLARPGELLPLRNLVITRLLLLQSLSDPAQKAQTAAQAREAAEALIAADPASSVAHLLSGKIAAFTGDARRAVADLNRAVELESDNGPLWYELFTVLESSNDAESQDKATEALRRAYRVVPNNLAMQVKWLDRQASVKDADIKQTAQSMQASLAKMPGLTANLVKRSNGVISDPVAWLDQVQGAAEKGDWQMVRRLVSQFANVVRPEPWTQSDLRRIERHPLEYVIYDFNASCPKRADADSSAPPQVTLSELPATGQPPRLVGVEDLQLADFDLDGRLDLIVLRDTAAEVYSRGQQGDSWRRIAHLSLPAGFRHLLVADLDRDDPQQPGTEAHRKAQQVKRPSAGGGPGNGAPSGGEATASGAAAAAADAPCHSADLDLIVYGAAGIRFLRNDLNDDGTRSLVEVPPSPELGDAKNVKAVVAADFSADGDLDVALAADDGMHLWSNRGDLTFADITGSCQLPPSSYSPSAIVAVDWDRDIDLDLVLPAAGGQAAGYLENLRHGQFRWRQFEPDFEALGRAEAVELFDVGQRGSWNLLTAGESGATLIQTDTSPSGLVTPKSGEQVSSTACRGVLTWDFDNDGNLDLATWTSKSIDFFRSAPGSNVPAPVSLLTVALQEIRVCRSGDLDGDGDEDLAVAEAGRVVLYSNKGGNDNSWIDVELRAGVVDAQTIAMRANHYGFGSIVEVRSGSRLQRRLVRSAKTHFGLGDARPDNVRVMWTTGVPQDVVEPGTNLVVCDEQVLLGSCPYLYTWNGRRFEFCTDCLWAAPLGLQLAEGHLAPSRSWEYLRIGGEQLHERDGCYPLQITEELWEAAYFDEVRLIAVDHPADVEIYSNEKVGPAEIAQFKIHTAREPRRPRAARDQRGRDILDRVRRRDRAYAKPFDRQLAFGYAEDHFVELDFGRLENARQITLFLTGWIFPSGTSTNVAISQNPGLKPPAPPSLWVPDADGGWREAIPYLGFPGGKTKTIAVDLNGLFPTGDCRLRIATNMEIYWDEAFITVNEIPAEVRQTALKLLDADLHYRGFSHRAPGIDNGPERYDYDRVEAEPKWPAMRGHFTRYGDVSELLTANDDRLVVLGAGDELSLRFSVPESAPPPGWKRDFLLYNVGWDKDCDLNTVYGEAVEPLPFGRMDSYPYVDDEAVADPATYLDYLRTYQTRTQHPGVFWTP